MVIFDGYVSLPEGNILEKEMVFDYRSKYWIRLSQWGMNCDEIIIWLMMFSSHHSYNAYPSTETWNMLEKPNYQKRWLEGSIGRHMVMGQN